jgi:hypothetical protein
VVVDSGGKKEAKKLARHRMVPYHKYHAKSFMQGKKFYAGRQLKFYVGRG